MAEAAEKLNITGLTVFLDGSFAMGLDKVVKPYITRLSDIGGGGNSAFCKLFAIFSFNTRHIPCAKVYKFNKGGLMNRILVQYRLLRRFL